MRWGLAVVAAVGCGEPAIELSLAPTPALTTSFDTSCVSAVAVQLDGGRYDIDPDDFVRDCIDLDESERGMTFADVRRSIAGRFKIELPESGLTAIELHGLRGTCAADERADADLVFYGASRYLDGDALTVITDANLGCTRALTTIRTIDIMKLRAPADCATASLASATGLALSTIRPLPFTTNNIGVDWWGGRDRGDIVDGVATFEASTAIAAGACLVASWLDADGASVSAGCISPESQNVCSPAGTREAPAVETSDWRDAIDIPKRDSYRGAVIGLAFNPTTGPVAGATVALNESDLAKRRGEVVYLTRDAETGAIEESPDQTATDASGLFAIYTRSLLVVTVTSGARVVERKVGTVGIDPRTGISHTAAMIVRL